MTHPDHPKIAWITGAGKGIGRALARPPIAQNDYFRLIGIFDVFEAMIARHV